MDYLRREFFSRFSGRIFVFLLFLVLTFNHAKAASIYFSPSSTQKTVGHIFTVAVKVNTGGVFINAGEGSVVFDSDKLQVTSVSKSGSIFSLWVSEPSFSNAEGTVYFSGGVPNPGFSGSNGLILNINFKAKTATTLRGVTEVVLVSGAVLANDGEGTNVLTSLGKANFYISPSVAPEESPIPSISGSLPPMIRSSTHPNQEKWYANKNPIFKWNLDSGVREVRLLLSKRISAVPQISYIPPISEKQLFDLEDGQFYLHGQFRTSAGLSQVATFKFQIDTQPPRDFVITRLDTADLTNPRPELLFESSDETSGIEKYQIKVGENDWIDIESSLAGLVYALPLQKYGTYPIEVKAIDKAGNTTTAKLEIEIEPLNAPVIKEITKEVKRKTPIVVKGTAQPGNKVIIEFTPGGSDRERFVYETTVGENGHWSLVVKDLPPGRYIVLAVAKDDRSALSKPSNSVNTRVRGGILDQFLKLFDGIIDFLSNKIFLIAFLGALGGLVVALIELFKTRGKKWLKPFLDLIVIKKAQKSSNKQIEHIVKDMEKEIEFLRSISQRRKLGSEENYLKNKIQQYLKTLKNLKGEGRRLKFKK